MCYNAFDGGTASRVHLLHAFTALSQLFQCDEGAKRGYVEREKKGGNWEEKKEREM